MFDSEKELLNYQLYGVLDGTCAPAKFDEAFRRLAAPDLLVGLLGITLQFLAPYADSLG